MLRPKEKSILRHIISTPDRACGDPHRRRRGEKHTPSAVTTPRQTYNQNQTLPPCVILDVHAQTTGGFASPGSLVDAAVLGSFDTSALDPWGMIQLTDGCTFVRDDGAALPSSATLLFYVESAAHPDDFARSQDAMPDATGGFSTTVVVDFPEGGSRLFLSFSSSSRIPWRWKTSRAGHVVTGRARRFQHGIRPIPDHHPEVD